MGTVDECVHTVNSNGTNHEQTEKTQLQTHTHANTHIYTGIQTDIHCVTACAHTFNNEWATSIVYYYTLINHQLIQTTKTKIQNYVKLDSLLSLSFF